jgi:hypothetical protein
MPIRQRMTEIEDLPSDPAVMGLVEGLWARLDEHDCCPFCGCVVREAMFPWRYERHDVLGRPYTSGPVAVCVGSRNVFTLKLLGLERAL